MINEINAEVKDGESLRKGYLFRDGYVFILEGGKDRIFDRLVVRSPKNAMRSWGKIENSERTLEEHIQLINRYKLKKALIICDDLSFILQCPSLVDISVFPNNKVGNNFDYSPLYRMPQIEKLHCATMYGDKECFKTTIDYSKINGILEMGISGEGHKGYEHIPTLEKLWISQNKSHKNFENISCSTNLKDVTLMSCRVQTLSGIENHSALQSVSLFHNRLLSDISTLSGAAESLRQLTIKNCPKITDLSVLQQLTNLEYLYLEGTNVLPNVEFIREMKKLKIFICTMNIEDGNLSLCKQVPFVRCKNRKHYNLKDKDLPKNIPEKGFELK